MGAFNKAVILSFRLVILYFYSQFLYLESEELNVRTNHIKESLSAHRALSAERSS